MPDFNRVKPFRFWCQKVLPLVYDDSLSYYELLNKVVDYLNKTIEDVNSVIQLTEDFTEEQAQAYAEFTANIEQTVDTLTNAFNTLHDFVDNYFDNLDVQEEIDNKLDEMALDGTLTNMVRPVAAAMIPGLVAQWLEDNITPTTPAVDRTLSVTGAAADAREVGYRLAWVGDSLNWVNNSKYDVATGEISENNDYARTPRIKGNLNEIIGIRSFASVPDAHAVLLYKNSNYIGYFTYATVEGNENYFYFLPDGTVTTAIEHDEYAINWIKNETYPVYDWTLRRTKLAGDVTELKNEALNADLSLEVMGSGQAELKNIPLIISSFINAETGAFTPTTTDNWAGTDFIEIPEGCYKITSNATAPSANFGLAFYDKDKQFISGSGVATYPAIDIRVELNYKYIRFTNYNADGDHSNVQLFFLGNKYGLYNEDNAPLELAIGNATLLRGSYTLNSTVTLGENQQIRGADCTVVVGENGKIIMSDGSAISGVNFVGEWNPTRTHGNGTTYTSYGYIPLIDYSDLETGDSDALFGENKTVSDAVIYIPTTGAFNAKVEGCTFTGFDRLAIYAGGQRHTENDNPVICNNYFVDCRMGVYVASEFTRLSCNEYLRCIVGCTLLGGNGNNVGEVYKCCDCGFYFPTPGTAHNEITSCEFAHCGLAGVYIQEIIARAGAQITGCQFADAPITGLSVNNVDIVGCRIDTWISCQNGKGNSIICSNIGNAYMYSHVELFNVPGDTLISFNRGLGTVADSDVNWKLSEIESIEDDIAELQNDVAGLKEDLTPITEKIIEGAYPFAIVDKHGKAALIVDENGLIGLNQKYFAADEKGLHSKDAENNSEIDYENNATFDYVVCDKNNHILFYVNKGELKIDSADIRHIENPQITSIDDRMVQAKRNKEANFSSELNMFIAYGQSWSVGYDCQAITLTSMYDNIMFNTGIKNNPLSDMSQNPTSFVPMVEYTGANTEPQTMVCGETPVSAMCRMVKQLIEEENGYSYTDFKYQILGNAPGYGDRTLTELAKGTIYYDRLISQVQAAYNIAQSLGKRLVVQAFSWQQLALGAGSTGTYAENLEQLRSDIDADVKAITGQTQTVKCITWQTFNRSATGAADCYNKYVGASETYPNIICSGASYQFRHVSENNLHLIATDNDWAGAYFGIAYKRTLIDGEKFIPLKPIKAEIHANTCLLTLNVPEKPIVFDTETVATAPNMGFTLLTSDGTEKTISSVEIVSPDTLKITATATINETDRIAYAQNAGTAFGPVNGNRGNVRDSQGNLIKCTAGNGEIIPVHNWLVVFDKPLNTLLEV